MSKCLYRHHFNSHIIPSDSLRKNEDTVRGSGANKSRYVRPEQRRTSRQLCVLKERRRIPCIRQRGNRPPRNRRIPSYREDFLSVPKLSGRRRPFFWVWHRESNRGFASHGVQGYDHQRAQRAPDCGGRYGAKRSPPSRFPQGSVLIAPWKRDSGFRQGS